MARSSAAGGGANAVVARADLCVGRDRLDPNADNDDDDADADADATCGFAAEVPGVCTCDARTGEGRGREGDDDKAAADDAGSFPKRRWWCITGVDDEGPSDAMTSSRRAPVQKKARAGGYRTREVAGGLLHPSF